MLSKFRISRLFSRALSPENAINRKSHYYFFCNHLCTTNASAQPDESPELPDWFEFFNTKCPRSANSNDEDFVIPSLANWVEKQRVEDHGKIVRHLLPKESDNEVDKITMVLKNRYASPESVVKALNGCDFTATNSLIDQLLKRFSSDWIPAFGVFIWAKTQAGYVHSPETYNYMVDILGKSKKFKIMWELVQEINKLNGYLTLLTMRKIFRRLSRAGLYTEAIDAFRGIERFGLSKNMEGMNVLMDALVKENSVENAHIVFQEFKNEIPLNLSSFNVLIHGWCRGRNLDNAWKTMEEMKNHGFQPDVVSYTSLIESYCREKDFRRVNQIVEEMEVNRCSPSVITYTIIMHALGKAKQINDAMEIYEKMKSKGCVADNSFYSSLIYILSQSGRFKDAKDIFEDIRRQGVSPDTLTYNTMISSACAHSEEETALRLLKKMEEESSCKPDIKTYHPLLKMCCRKKWIKVLKFLLAHMMKNDVSIDVGTYAVLVSGLCKSGKVGEACLFFGKMVSKGMRPRDSLYNMLKEELEKKSMVNEMELVEKMMCLAKEREVKSRQNLQIACNDSESI